MATYGLKKSFHVDHGELDGLRSNECFVLGYELALVDEGLKRPAAISRPIHVENRERVEEACRDSGRAFRLTWMPGDVSETWLQLEVAPQAE